MSGSSFEAGVVLRPRSLDETLDLALAYVRAHARDFRKLFIVLALLQFVPVALHFAFAGGMQGEGMGTRAALAIVLMGLAERVWTVFTSRHLFGNKVSVSTALLTVAKKGVAAVFLTVMSTLPWLLVALWINNKEEALIGFGAFFVTIWFLIWSSHYAFREVYHLEHLSLSEAGKRTRGLCSRRAGRSMALLIISTGLRLLFIFCIGAALDVVLELMLQFELEHPIITELTIWVGWIAAGPYVATVRLFDYIDARTRREGWDIQVRLSAIAQRSEQERASRMAA